MQKTVGIIAEYDPFHSGHAYHLAEAKRATGAERAIAVMSGSFTQRGSVACFDKFDRAKWALSGGADMVVELPVVFSLAPADAFAHGGVSLVAACGADALSFGAETADIAALTDMASLLADDDDSLRALFREKISSGLSYPAALARACAERARDGRDGRTCDIPLTPNNILSLEYIRAAARISPGIELCPVAREGASHNAPIDGCAAPVKHASASALRALIASGDAASIAPYVEKAELDDIMALTASHDGPRSSERLSQAVTAALLPLSRERIAELPYISEGLENVIYQAVRSEMSFTGIVKKVKSKRYTEARLRRALLSALLGISKSTRLRASEPLYIRVLGVRREALPLLASVARKGLPVITSYADCRALSADARAMLELDILARELAALACPTVHKIESEFSRKLLII